MDIPTIVAAMGGVKLALELGQKAASMIPDRKKRKSAEAALANAQKELILAEVTLAASLDHELCRNHFPPGIMTTPDDDNWKCPVCGNERNTGIGSLGYLGDDEGGKPSKWG